MIDKIRLLRKLETEIGLRQIKLEKEHQELRAQMVEKHGLEAVERFEATVQDGEGIAYVLRKTGDG